MAGAGISDHGEVMSEVPANNDDEYGASSIKVLKGLDAVRKRPGMYIGDTDDGSGLHHMVYEVVDNAVDEALAGHANRIDVTLNPDGSCTVRDNGRGIPTDIHKEEGVSRRRSDHDPAACRREIRAERLQGLRRPAWRGRVGGQRAVANSWTCASGARARNITCSSATAIPWRRSKIVADAPTASKGTEVTFLPSTGTFTKTEFDFATLEHRLRELAFLNSGVTIMLADKRGVETKEVTLHYEGGLKAFVRISRPRQEPADPRARDDRVRTRRHDGGNRADLERQLSREHAGLHQQHPPARRRHASGRLPRRPDPRGDQICRRHAAAPRRTRWR